MRGSPTFFAFILWILLALGVSAILIRQDLSSLGRHQGELLDAIEAQLSERLDHGRVLLKNVTRLFGTSDHTLFTPTLPAELENLLPLAPVVKRIQVQQLVRSDEIQAFEQRMRKQYPDFLLHGLSAMTPPATENSGHPVFHPLVLVVPQTPAANPPLLGTDLGLVPALQGALLTARASHDFTYSSLYNQARGEPLLNIFLTSRHDRQLIASVVIDANRWLQTRLLPGGSRLTLRLAPEDAITSLTIAGQDPVLFHLTREREIHFGALPARLTLAYPIHWHDFSGWALLPLVISTLGSLLLFAWIRQRQAASQCRLQTQETGHLKHHLQQHSDQLQQQLQENQRLTHRILDIQERERRHLAQELHDELGQCLTAIRTDARMLLQDHPNTHDSVNHHAGSIDTIACHIYDVTYDLMHALRPTLLDDLGLVDAVRELIRGLNMERQGIETALQLKGALNDMEERYNINLYRMIQEALTNLQRHARCSQASILLQRLGTDSSADRLELDIRDNGCGFDPEIISRKGRFGVLGMQARAKALGGSLTLKSAPGRGTLLQIRIPLAVTEGTDAATLSAAESAVPLPSDAAHQPA